MKTQIKIIGMHCNSCSMLIQDVLEDIKGIKSAKVSYEDAKAIVEFDDKQTNLDKIKKAIIKEGYKIE